MDKLQKTGIALLGIVLSIGLADTTQAQSYGDAGITRFSPIMPNPERNRQSPNYSSRSNGRWSVRYRVPSLNSRSANLCNRLDTATMTVGGRPADEVERELIKQKFGC
jgi:hypothetical protein